VISLEAAIRTALGQHPSIRQGKAVVDQSKALVGEQISNYYPQLTGQLAYERVKRGFVGGVAGRATVSQFSQYTTGLTGTQTIYDFGRTGNAVQAARDTLQSSRYGLSSTESSVVLNVKVAYFQVLEALRLLQVANASVARLKEHLDQAQGFYGVGLRPKIDVTRARTDLASGVADQVREGGNVLVAKATLNNTMGVVLGLGYDVIDVPVQPLTPSFEPLVAQALDRRPEVKQALAKNKGFEAQVAAARANYWPEISGRADYNYSGDAFPLPNNWDLGATVNVPIFNGLLTASQVDAAKAVLRQGLAALETVRQQVRLDVESSWLNVKAAGEQLAAQREAVRAARENLDLAQARYREGLGSAVEYTDAQVALTQAEGNEAQALYSLQIAQAQLDRAVAGPMALTAPGI
jgi:outer membrane protein TolC